MKFKDELIQMVESIGSEKILESLGYQNTSHKHSTRLQKVIESDTLGLDEAYFDFKYSNSDYILKLAEICDISINEAKQFIVATTDKLTEKKQAFKPYVFVNTGFKRTSQPIFALALLEHRRYINFPVDFYEVAPLTI